MLTWLTDDHPQDVNDVMGHGGACPQQRQAAIGLPAREEMRKVSLRGLNEHSVDRRWRHSLPSEHAMEDSEEEDEVKDAFPVWHHHSIGSTQMRLTLRWHEITLRGWRIFRGSLEGGLRMKGTVLLPSLNRSPWNLRWTHPALMHWSDPPCRWRTTPQTLDTHTKKTQLEWKKTPL